MEVTNFLSFLKELLRASSVEVAEVRGVHNVDMRTQSVSGAVEVEVAIGGCGTAGEMGDEVTAETVATPHTEFRAPVVSKRLLVGARTGHGQYPWNADQRCDDSLRETRFCEDEHLTVEPLLLHLADGLAQQLGCHASSCIGIAPSQFIGAITGAIVAVAAPE